MYMARGKFQLLINEGNRLKNEKEFTEAIEMFNKAKEESEEREEELLCLFSMIDCAINIEDYALGEKLCNKILLKFGEIEDVYLNLAYIKEQERKFLDSYKNLQNAYIISKKEIYKDGLKSRFLKWEKDIWFEYKYNISIVEFKKAFYNLEDLFCLICIQGEGEIRKDEVYEKYTSLLIQTMEYSRIYNLKNRLRSFNILEKDIDILLNEKYFFDKIKKSSNKKEIYYMLIDFLLIKEKRNLYYLEKLKASIDFPDKEYFKCLVEEYLNRPKEEKISCRNKEYEVELEIYDLAYNYIKDEYRQVAQAILNEISDIRKA